MPELKKHLLGKAISLSIILLITGCSHSGTKVSIDGTRWLFNDRVINEGSPAEGLLMNVRMVNAVFEDESGKINELQPGFDPGENTSRFIEQIPAYVAQGMNAFTISLQGGMPGYEGAVNSAFNADGTLRMNYLERVARVIRAADENGAAVILSCFYQRQHSHTRALQDQEAVKNALVNVVEWIREQGFSNVILEVSNEYSHGGYQSWPDGDWIRSEEGQAELIKLAKKAYPDLPVSTSGMGNGTVSENIAGEADFLIIHFNNTTIANIPEKINRLKKFNKPVVCNEDDKTGQEGAQAAFLSVKNGAGWGLMQKDKNQSAPFEFEGAADDPEIYSMISSLTKPGLIDEIAIPGSKPYFPPPDSLGGWRTLTGEAETRQEAGMDKSRLDEAFDYIRKSTKNGGLLVVRNGWLVYERYFGLGHRMANPNLASCGKSFTSIAVGIMLGEHPELFPDGLDQKVFTPEYFPREAFPLTDPKKADIRLGHLLAFTGGIRGNNPSFVNGNQVQIDPPGPDGWLSMVDSIAQGLTDYREGSGKTYSAKTLWCEPGGGYSYATSSIHLASVMLRHITGTELDEYIRDKIAAPLGWGGWGYAYRNYPRVTHASGGGGIALHATDMLRFCYLLLNDGRWEDKQVVPEEYVHKCRTESPYNTHYPYSLQFNVNTRGNEPGLPLDAYWKTGSGGHCFYIVPSLRLVVWKLGGRDGQYSPENTGFPLPEEAVRTGMQRDRWKSTVTDEEAVPETLRLVIEAIVD